MRWKIKRKKIFGSKIFLLATIAFFSITFISAGKNRMKLEVTKRLALEGVPSASGIEFFNDSIYALGDNSPWLFKLDATYKFSDKFQIYPLEYLENDTLKKSRKPDFEAMTVIQTNGLNEFYIFGSGSKSPMRDVLIIINPEHPEKVKQFSLTAFYTALKSLCGLSEDELNIEAAAVCNGFLYLFNRGKNTIIKVSIPSFNSFIHGKTNGEITMRATNVELPKINEIESGFSGACYVPEIDKILFTSSVEDTPNWIDDGQVLGSFVGVIDLTNIGATAKPMCVPVSQNGNQVALKVEAIAVQSVQKNNIRLILATDSDGGSSEILEATLTMSSR
jgi:hypothetical protein